ncbi:MAG: WbqC family protein, partial [Alistipes sp.]
SVEYCARLLRGDCVVDLGEHFVKRSERNRARILVPNGVMEMTAQVRNANRPCTPMRDVLLDYSKRWQHQHWTALVSSYKASPYFDHYAARFEKFYRAETRYLVDYNQELLAVLISTLGIPTPTFSECYIHATEEDYDLRPKHKKSSDDFSPEPYFQVFADRLPFEPNLSVVDLLFAEGPAAVSVLRRCLP